jgi:hypothetical protein
MIPTHRGQNKPASDLFIDDPACNIHEMMSKEQALAWYDKNFSQRLSAWSSPPSPATPQTDSGNT